MRARGSGRAGEAGGREKGRAETWEESRDGEKVQPEKEHEKKRSETPFRNRRRRQP